MKVSTQPTSPFGFQLGDRVVSKLETTVMPGLPRMTGTVTKVWAFALIVTWDSGKTRRFDKHSKPEAQLAKLRDGEDW